MKQSDIHFKLSRELRGRAEKLLASPDRAASCENAQFRTTHAIANDLLLEAATNHVFGQMLCNEGE